MSDQDIPSISPILLVEERIPLLPDYANPVGAARAAESYDELVHQNAHASAGHLGHAHFLFEAESDSLVVLYAWNGADDFEEMLEREHPVLADWFSTYCAGPRVVTRMSELAVTPVEKS